MKAIQKFLNEEISLSALKDEEKWAMDKVNAIIKKRKSSSNPKAFHNELQVAYNEVAGLRDRIQKSHSDWVKNNKLPIKSIKKTPSASDRINSFLKNTGNTIKSKLKPQIKGRRLSLVPA